MQGMKRNVTQHGMVMKPFRERLQNEVIVFDGGVGTYLYEKGVYINTCFDELNLTNADLVAEIHRDYIQAGADVVETNTFGANRIKLAPHGLETKVYEINKKGAEIARKVAGDSTYVAGSVGPLGVQIEPIGKLSFDEVREIFKEQIKGLLDGGVDLIVLETFSLVSELLQAIKAVRELDPKIPLMAQMTVNDDGVLLSGAPLESFVRETADCAVDVVGLNCSVGPKAMLDALGRSEGDDQAADLRAAERRRSAECGRAKHLHDLARVHRGICEAVHPDGRHDRWRVLRHKPRPYPGDPPGRAGAAAGQAHGQAARWS